ncbi:sulfate permease [Brachybacterium alimentarium]|uniref:sulfate permease n=1 Tax=Brachybacterium alimentarium TaxID=47845 RepID=UPI000DF47F2A|nr:sulfate permease [Brachybacterium alimentarium]RCS79455.1 sulfate permease [Brachybacterium alimentarium]
MFRLIWFASIHIRYFMRRWMPTNIVLDKVRTRRGLKWGVPVMLLAIPYLYLASLLIVIIRDGGPGWLNLVVLVAIWSALKMLWIGPVSLILLARVRIREHAERRAQRRQARQAQASSSEPVMAGGAS